MTEIITREIVGLATKSKWNKIKEMIKNLLKKTLKENAGYTLIALDAYINKKKKEEFTDFIKTDNDIQKINGISSFSNLSLYQYTETSTDHINISQQEGIIILIAKYLGPTIDQHEHFDFMIHMDPVNNPYFTYGSGKILNCSEMLENIHKNKNIKEKAGKRIKPKTSKLMIEGDKTKKQKNKKSKMREIPKKQQLKQENDIKVQDIEVFIFEKITGKNPLWGGKETKSFIAWKKKMVNIYKKESGKGAYYKGYPTKNYKRYLEDILKINKKKEIKKQSVLKKKTNQKKKSNKISKNRYKEISEHLIFEKITNKKAFWGGKETRSFTTWRGKIREKYSKKTGKTTHYKGKYTANYKSYLEKL